MSGTDCADFTYDVLDRVTRVEYNSDRYICNTYNDPPEEGKTVPEGTPQDGSLATVTMTGDGSLHWYKKL